MNLKCTKDKRTFYRIIITGDNMLICHLERVIKNSGYKKSHVAAHIGITVRQLRKYETMESLAPVDKTYMLADLLNCKFEDIYEWERGEKKNGEEEKHI